ncbi:velvet factor-domain-containing protein [Rhodofomes roseus]|uniref:Velvet factor-domain-containing protein n=1 Tax=Rhodofomes roseus TaxID=34475 RepID=A0ABQ8KBR2_9APHY|nr:velvet factor-domain-containing protein [Rhodofomes roseus]KAH9834749.1 velvet factor-domain-containing protein [Rhodofomes roseus]
MATRLSSSSTSSHRHSLSAQDRKVRPVGSSSRVGRPIRFVGDLGRKYARKDRRPLDPPPVVQFQLFEVLHADTPSQTEREFEDYDAIKSFGVLCHVDLFPVPDQDGDESDGSEESTSSQSQASTSTFHPQAFPAPSPAPGPSRASSNPYHSIYSPPPSPGSYFMPQLMPSSLAHHIQSIPAPLPPPDIFPYPLPTTTAALLQSFTMPVAAPLPPLAPELSLNLPGASYDLMQTQMNQHSRHGDASPMHGQSHSGPLDPDIVAYMGDFAIRESSKCTADLVGATFVQSSGLEYKGKKALMFVFSDLAVKTEGTFILRYRVFNIFSQASGIDVPILAQCFGGPFKIYPSKEFPGLRASTDLTKHISHFGVRLNLRETERKRRRHSESSADRSQDSAPPSSGETSSKSPNSTSSGTTSDRSESRGKGKDRAYDIDGISETSKDD